MDCTEGLELLKDVIDLIVTSPPYNVDLGKNKYNKIHMTYTKTTKNTTNT